MAVNIGSTQNIVRENIEWCRIWVPGINQTDKPRILLIGDSITEGYSGTVEKLLEGKAYVARLSTSKSLGDPLYLDEVKMVLANTTFKVIHFNNGMHGGGYNETEYQRDYKKLVALLKKNAPGSKLICATTTAQRTSNQLDKLTSFTDRIKARNDIAREAIKGQGIKIDDLYALLENRPEFYSQDGTHSNDKGIEAEGQQVAKIIAEELAAK